MIALTRRAALGASLSLLAAPLPLRHPRAQGLEKFVIQTGWRAQAEHGGFYQALAKGMFRDVGLDCEVRMGGPQLDANGLLLAGRVQMATGTAFTGLNFARNDLPAVVVATTFQRDTRILLSHAGVGNDRLTDLRGKPVLVAAIGRTTFWPWLRTKYGFTDEQIRPYTFSLAPFLQNRQLSVQGLATSEPLDARRAGVSSVVHHLWEYGWHDYQQTLTVTRRLLDDRPDLIGRALEATARGWRSYLHEDPEPGNQLIKAANPDMDDEKIAFARDTMRADTLIDGGDAARLGIGAMTEERWRSFYDSMVEAGTLPAGIDVMRAFSLRFVKGTPTLG